MAAPFLVAFCEAPVSGPVCIPVTAALASPSPHLGTVAPSVFVPPKGKPGEPVKRIESGQSPESRVCFRPVYPFKTYILLHDQTALHESDDFTVLYM